MEVTNVAASNPQNMPVNGAATTTSAVTTGNGVRKSALNSTFQAISAAAATVIIEATNDEDAAGLPVNWNATPLGTITLAGAGQDGFAISAAWKWVRARVTAATTATRVKMGG